MAVPGLLLVLLGYLLGSIPTAFLAGRCLRGVDLRHYGSGTVSGTGVFYHVARWAIVPVGLLDIAKAALPAWLALRMNLGLWWAALAGVAAIVGHNWPIYLGFQGGRGISPFLGTLLVLFPWGFPWMLLFLGLGKVLQATAIAALVAIGTLPLVTLGSGQPAQVTVACLAMVALTILKRLEANRSPLPKDAVARRRVWLNRLLLDRDTDAWDSWMLRKPPAAH